MGLVDLWEVSVKSPSIPPTADFFKKLSNFGKFGSFFTFEVQNGLLQTSLLEQSCLEFNFDAFRLLKIQNRLDRSRDRKLVFSAFDPHLKAFAYKTEISISAPRLPILDF